MHIYPVAPQTKQGSQKVEFRSDAGTMDIYIGIYLSELPPKGSEGAAPLDRPHGNSVRSNDELIVRFNKHLNVKAAVLRQLAPVCAHRHFCTADWLHPAVFSSKEAVAEQIDVANTDHARPHKQETQKDMGETILFSRPETVLS